MRSQHFAAHRVADINRRTRFERAGRSTAAQAVHLGTERTEWQCLDDQSDQIRKSPSPSLHYQRTRLDPMNGHPIDAPFLVAHFHDPSRQWGSTGFGSATVTGMFVADLFETSGDIWMTTIGSE